MSKELINTILKFLERVQLQGNEAPMFMQVVQQLNALMNPPALAPVDEPQQPAS